VRRFFGSGYSTLDERCSTSVNPVKTKTKQPMKKLLLMLSVASTTAIFAQDQRECQVVADPYTDCRKGITYLNATPGFDSYQWTPAAQVSNPAIANPTTTIPGWYTVTASTVIGPELVVNGDFSAGATGFISGQTLSMWYSPCNYWVGPGWFSNTLDPTTPDHTTTADNMYMAIDGCSPATLVWEQTMSVASMTNYTFSFWATRADQVQPNFEIHFIGDVTGDVIVSTQAGIPYVGQWEWDKYPVSCWNSEDNSTVTIQVINLETNSYGNDFAMDDFSFRECCTSSFTVWAPTMMGQNLFTNADFSQGNTGFTSGHTYSTWYSPGNYYVGPGWFSSTLDPMFPDHTLTSDNMFMSVDGMAAVLWEETVPVTPATVYQFSFWATRADQVTPIFEIHFIGNVTGDVIVSTQPGILATPGVWEWDEYGVPCWFSDQNTSVTVQVVNLEPNGYGNDFGMDDFSLRQCCRPDECCRKGPSPLRVDQPANSAVSVYPNPSNGGAFTIQFADAAENVQVELINVLGERVDAFSFSGTVYNYAPADALAPGVYMLRITNNGVETKKEIMVE
jgi:hypothetical protein